MKKTLILLMIGFAMTGCSRMKEKNAHGMVQLNGRIEKLEVNSFQYGTHTLKQGEKLFVLKSDKVNLDAYVNKQVSLKGVKLAGYPVENGPDYINVKEIFVK